MSAADHPVTIVFQVEPDLFAAIDREAGRLGLRPAEYARRYLAEAFHRTPRDQHDE